ncbi:MAG: hypothetical protein MJ061_03000 [Mailhella sp.]|nr:hypothetical protein [Mailhella sp.]
MGYNSMLFYKIPLNLKSDFTFNGNVDNVLEFHEGCTPPNSEAPAQFACGFLLTDEAKGHTVLSNFYGRIEVVLKRTQCSWHLVSTAAEAAASIRIHAHWPLKRSIVPTSSAVPARRRQAGFVV